MRTDLGRYFKAWKMLHGRKGSAAVRHSHNEVLLALCTAETPNFLSYSIMHDMHRELVSVRVVKGGQFRSEVR